VEWGEGGGTECRLKDKQKEVTTLSLLFARCVATMSTQRDIFGALLLGDVELSRLHEVC